MSRDIDDLIEGGENAERAKMSLSLAKKSAIAPLIAALQERQHTSRARVDMVETLRSLYLREPDERILQALVAHIGDADPAVRRKIAWPLAICASAKALPPCSINWQSKPTTHPGATIAWRYFSTSTTTTSPFVRS